LTRLFRNASLLDDQRKKSLGLSLENMLIRCKYLNQNCNLTQIEWAFDSSFGNCYIFDPKGVSVKASAIKASLQLELFSGIEKTLPSFADAKGFKIMLFSKNEDLDFTGKIEKISVSISSELTMVLSRYVHKMVEFPYSSCRINADNQDKYRAFSKFIDDRLSRNISYKQANCMQFYLGELVLETCKCRINNEQPSNIKWCYTDEELKCQTALNKDFLYGDLGDQLELKCPLECTRSYYDYLMSVNSFPSRSYASYLIRTNRFLGNLSVEEVQESVSRVNIYFKNLAYELTEESVIFAVPDLLANIGGILGLGLGMSLMSFIEALEIALFLLFLAWSSVKLFKKKKYIIN